MSTVYSITELNQQIKDLLESHPVMRNIFVRGEISNYKKHTSGHHYMTLKDEGGSISAVLFRGDAGRLRFALENGMKIIARGRVSSFPKTGQVQLYLSDIMPDGIGNLHIAFEQLKKKLSAEGLFAEAHKKPIPTMPHRIAVVTSPTGAAVRDMLRILQRRWPLAEVTVFPVLVQGDGAKESIAQSIALINAMDAADVILCGRGGGSMEDLWAFNEELVARAIYDSIIPVISCVGHEPDVTIADFVADLRAPTPSGAAELAVPNQMDFKRTIAAYRLRIARIADANLRTARQQLGHKQARLSAKTPTRYIEEKRILLDRTTDALHDAVDAALSKKRLGTDALRVSLQNQMDKTLARETLRFAKATATLDALSPLKVLGRGYSVTMKDNEVIADAGMLKKDDKITVRFASGEADCTVISTKEGER